MRARGAAIVILCARAAFADPQPTCATPQACEGQCKKADAAACSTLGLFLLYTATTPQRKAVALRAFEKACDGGEPVGCEYAARMLADGSPRKDPQEARARADRGCRLGGQKSCELAAVILAAAPARQAFADGAPSACSDADQCRTRCDAGEGHACHLLGAQLDPIGARGANLRGCEQGDAEACSAAAALLQAGQGGPADAGLALQLLVRACDLGLARACSKAAGGLPKRAKALRRRACALDQRECAPATPR